MAEKEKEVQLLLWEQLQGRELELARLKLTNLREAPIQSGVSVRPQLLKYHSEQQLHMLETMLVNCPSKGYQRRVYPHV